MRLWLAVLPPLRRRHFTSLIASPSFHIVYAASAPGGRRHVPRQRLVATRPRFDSIVYPRSQCLESELHPARTKGLFRVKSRRFCRMSNRFDTMSDDFDRIVDSVDSVDYLDTQVISGNHFETIAG